MSEWVLRCYAQPQISWRDGLKWVHFVWQRQRQRRQLLQLEDYRLLDLGISREQADHEGQKAFWQD